MESGRVTLIYGSSKVKGRRDRGVTRLKWGRGKGKNADDDYFVFFYLNFILFYCTLIMIIFPYFIPFNYKAPVDPRCSHPIT